MTQEEMRILAHVVVDPESWLAHAIATFGEATAQAFLQQKCARWRPVVQETDQRGEYKTRVERDATEVQRRVR